VGGSIRSSAAWPTGEADRGEASIRGQTRSPNDVIRSSGRTAWPSVDARSDTRWADQFVRSEASGGGDWPGEQASRPASETHGRGQPRPASEAASTDAVWPIAEGEMWRPSETAAGSATWPDRRTFAEGELRLANEANAKGDVEPVGETLAGDGPWPTNAAVTGDRSWPLSEAVPEDAAWRPSADRPSGDINPRRLPPSGQQVRAPAWDAPTVLLSQVGRAGDLTPAQAYRAGRGRSW
jgi:hypothetical protein